MTTDHIEASPDDGVAGTVRSAGGASVLGERDIPSVNQQRSLQNRVNNSLALMVVTALFALAARSSQAESTPAA